MINLDANMTVRQLRAFVRTKCKTVLIQPRFGTSETWVKISKSEALELLKSGNPDDTAADLKIYGGNFGSMTDCAKEFYLGG